ncbi:hypothetical protein BaRGS_00016260 [Batillaria attramentaria]|uniref:Uncharacterized protein n=1 Tax=Batillaria attramentaria TaxID=370345 RepID=A0ABD0L047_9CAEN
MTVTAFSTVRAHSVLYFQLVTRDNLACWPNKNKILNVLVKNSSISLLSCFVKASRIQFLRKSNLVAHGGRHLTSAKDSYGVRSACARTGLLPVSERAFPRCSRGDVTSDLSEHFILSVFGAF